MQLAETKPTTPAELIAFDLRKGLAVDDAAFDALLSALPQKKSKNYWTCVEAAQTASRLFREAGAERILDVGSGCGKFCTIASLTLGHRVWGLEFRDELVFEARQLAQRLDAEVVIMEGTLATVTPGNFDGFYFYNPFAEYVADDAARYDSAFPRSFDAYLRDAGTVEDWLRAAPIGTAIVTYNGLGGRIPASFSVRKTTEVRGDVMRLWVKEREDDGGEAYLEIEDMLIAASELLGLATAPGNSIAHSPLVAALCRPREAPGSR